MRLVVGIVFIPLYIGWIIYRAFIKKDLKKNMNDLYGLTFFLIIWGIVMYLIFG